MKHSGLILNMIIAIVFLLITLSGCIFPPKPAQYTEFYVSVKGSDSSGDGSKSKPWRHIQHAIDAANAKSGTTLRLNLLKGIYEEELVIHKPLVLKGAGIGKATTWPTDPLYPQEEVTIITVKQLGDNPRILIENATSVNLQDLVVQFGGIRAVNTRFIMYNVEIPDSQPLYSVQIENCSLFYIEKSQIRTYLTRSDYGIDIIASEGDIWDTYIGDEFDHAINITPQAIGTPVSPYKNIDILVINIHNTEIAGARIGYADGIRLNGPANLSVSDTKITRSHPTNESGEAWEYNRPHAGISLSGYLYPDQGYARVEIIGLEISGFDVGIGLNPLGYDVKVQNSNISGVSYDVETIYSSVYNQYTNAGANQPVIDFGGGPLGSVGENDFANTSPYAFYNNVPYDVDACYNEWNVPITQIDLLRVFDELDVGTKGRVKWTCSTDVILDTPSPSPTSPGRTVTVTRDALCFAGPGEDYGVVSTIFKDQQVELIGIGEGDEYYVVTNPRYLVPCWVRTSSVSFDGDPGDLPVIPVPPLTLMPDQPVPSDTPRPPGMLP